MKMHTGITRMHINANKDMTTLEKNCNTSQDRTLCLIEGYRETNPLFSLGAVHKNRPSEKGRYAQS